MSDEVSEMNFIKVVFAGVIGVLSCQAMADPAWAPDVPKARAAFEKETGIPLRAGHRIEPTIFKGYYAVRTSKSGGASAYFREDMAWLGNIKSPGWSIQSPADNSSGGKRAWLQQQLGQVPLDRLVLVKRSTPPVAVIWSAPDCPYCRMLEKALEQEGASVYVAPVGVSESGFGQAAKVYCSGQPAQTWKAVMQNAGATDDLPKPACDYPRDMLSDIGFFFGMGRPVTPIVIFADGFTITGWGEQGQVLLRQKIGDKIFFND